MQGLSEASGRPLREAGYPMPKSKFVFHGKVECTGGLQLELIDDSRVMHLP